MEGKSCLPKVVGTADNETGAGFKKESGKKKKEVRGRALSHYASVAATPFGLDSVYGVVSQQHR